MERAVILTKNTEIQPEDLPLEITDVLNPQVFSAKSDNKLTLEEIEKNVILNRLLEHNWNQTRTAADLGIGITTL